MRVLFLDDDERIRRGVVRLGGLCGYEVTAVATPEDAISAFEQRPFPVVLADEGLAGGRSGLELLDWVALRAPDVRLVLSSGTSPPDSFRYDPPARDFLRKPFGRAELEALLGPPSADD